MTGATTRDGRVRLDVLAVISTGGALGAAARYGLARAMPTAAGHFPWATFWTNVSGSFVLGLFLVVVLGRFAPSGYLRPLFATGFVGSYTTFSTFAVDTDVLIRDGHISTAVAYVVSSLVVGLLVAWLGIVLGRLVCGARRRPGPAPRVSLVAWLAFLAAGAVGAPLRFLVDGYVQDRTGGALPWGTFVVNVVGSFLLGVLTGLALHHGLGATTKTVLGTGFCGTLTTFSTFTFETIRLAEDGALRQALTNVAASVVVATAAGALGLAITLA